MKNDIQHLEPSFKKTSFGKIILSENTIKISCNILTYEVGYTSKKMEWQYSLMSNCSLLLGLSPD